MWSEGFEKQIEANKALADEAISKLPAINANIQQAVGKNAQTQGVLDNVAGDYNQALDHAKKLGDALQGIKVRLLTQEHSENIDSDKQYS